MFATTIKKCLILTFLFNCSEAASSKAVSLFQLEYLMLDLAGWDSSVAPAIQTECLTSIKNFSPEKYNGDISENCRFVMNKFSDFRKTSFGKKLSQKVDKTITFLKAHIQELQVESTRRKTKVSAAS